MSFRFVLTLAMFAGVSSANGADQPIAFFEKHCHACHDDTTTEAGLDLTSLKVDLADRDTFARWVKVYDRIDSGPMPPTKKARPAADELLSVKKWLHDSLVNAELAQRGADGRTGSAERVVPHAVGGGMTR